MDASHCAEFQARIAAINAASIIQLRAINEKDLSDEQQLGLDYSPERTACSHPRPFGFDSTISYNKDSRTKISVHFTEMDPKKPCQAVATSIVEAQGFDTNSTEARKAVEDSYVAAAVRKFGAPTYFSPRHVGPYVDYHVAANMMSVLSGVGPVPATLEKRMLPPFAAWCDTGTIKSCETGGTTVNHRLTLIENEVLSTFELTLTDLHAMRIAKAASDRSSFEQNKPQL